MLTKMVLLAGLLVLATPLGLPFENTWFAGFVAGVSLVGLFVSAVTSMMEPDDNSSHAYVWLFRFGHSALHLGTAYFAHRSQWKFFRTEKKESE